MTSENDNNIDNQNQNLKYITKEEIHEEIGKLNEEVETLTERIDILLGSMGFCV